MFPAGPFVHACCSHQKKDRPSWPPDRPSVVQQMRSRTAWCMSHLMRRQTKSFVLPLFFNQFFLAMMLMFDNTGALQLSLHVPAVSTRWRHSSERGGIKCSRSDGVEHETQKTLERIMTCHVSIHIIPPIEYLVFFNLLLVLRLKI